MPLDSNWNTPIASPRASIAYVASSSSGTVSMSSSTPWRSRMSASAPSMTSMLRRPRKSIFSRPSASTSWSGTWVTTLPSSSTRTGT